MEPLPFLVAQCFKMSLQLSRVLRVKVFACLNSRLGLGFETFQNNLEISNVINSTYVINGS